MLKVHACAMVVLACNMKTMIVVQLSCPIKFMLHRGGDRRPPNDVTVRPIIFV